jgi:hypothetical protein
MSSKETGQNKGCILLLYLLRFVTKEDLVVDSDNDDLVEDADFGIFFKLRISSDVTHIFAGFTLELFLDFPTLNHTKIDFICITGS